MGEWFSEYLEQLKELWGNLDKRAQVIIVLGVILVFGFLLFIIIWSGDAQYQVLFSQLDPSDANTIVNRLEESGTPYKLEDKGRTILVSEDVVYQTRIEMAGEGLPSQGVVGFEIFDQSSFGTTDFERKVNFYRALGGELSRSIQAMDTVQYARVQITAPEDSIFAEEEQPAEASVLLKIVSGYSISESQVRAISNLVASSAQELETDNVTIVDTAGNLLTNNTNGDQTHSQLTSNQFEIQRQFADGLKSDLNTMLTRILGPDNFTVQVKAKLDFDQREVESKEYSPVVDDEGIVRSEEEHTESYQGSNNNGEGVPGTTSNIPQYQTEDNQGTGEYERSDSVINYEINEKIERHVYAPGEVEELSVAVAVNDTQSSADLDMIRDVVEAAIGYSEERGDIVTVTGLAFDRSLEEEIAEAEASTEAQEQTKTMIYAGLIGFILLILFILIMVLRRSGEPVEEEIVPGKAMDYMVDDEEIEEELAAGSQLSKEERKKQKLRETIGDIVADKPDEVAQLLKTWLTED